MSRPTQAIISRSALRHNAGIARALAPDSQVMAVVKANAYGHGAAEVAAALVGNVDAFAVACLEEATALRDYGIELPILLLEGVFDATELAPAAALNLWLTIENESQLAMLELEMRGELSESTNRPAHAFPCWLKVDTGMHRLGFLPARAAAACKTLQASKHCAEEPILFTHFADAETVGGEATANQLARFNSIELAEQKNLKRSACNSAALLTLPQAHFDWVRPGYILYGNSPLEQPHPSTDALRPAMTLRSAISSLRRLSPGDRVGYGGSWTAQRPTTIATVPVGYGDGYPRSAPAGTPVLVNGERVPLAGRVSMDMITLDVTELPNTALGDEVILWGPTLSVNEIARHAGSNGYELTTRMPARTPRIFIND